MMDMVPGDLPSIWMGIRELTIFILIGVGADLVTVIITSTI